MGGGGRVVKFFLGLHQPSDARHFDQVFISVNRLRDRKGPFEVNEWILDSGAYTEVSRHGRYRTPPVEYAKQIRRWSSNGNMLAAVSQDYMCEAHVLAKTGLTVRQHQDLTLDRYDNLYSCLQGSGVYLLPVLQGYAPQEYVDHLRMYGSRLVEGAWVGVGSVCKRNNDPAAIASVLGAVLRKRPDLRLHGFGLKATALANATVRRMLHTADSMAWSFEARYEGRNANDWREARQWLDNLEIAAGL